MQYFIKRHSYFVKIQEVFEEWLKNHLISAACKKGFPWQSFLNIGYKSETTRLGHYSFSFFFQTTFFLSKSVFFTNLLFFKDYFLQIMCLRFSRSKSSLFNLFDMFSYTAKYFNILFCFSAVFGCAGIIKTQPLKSILGYQLFPAFTSNTWNLP